MELAQKEMPEHDDNATGDAIDGFNMLRTLSISPRFATPCDGDTAPITAHVSSSDPHKLVPTTNTVAPAEFTVVEGVPDETGPASNAGSLAEEAALVVVTRETAAVSVRSCIRKLPIVAAEEPPDTVVAVRQDSMGRRSDAGEAGDKVLKSISLSREAADRVFKDVDSSIVAQVGDSGDRVVDAPEESSKVVPVVKFDEIHDDPLIMESGLVFDVNMKGSSPVSPLPEEIMSAIASGAVVVDAEPDKNGSVQLVKNPSVKDALLSGQQEKLPRRLDYFCYLLHLSLFGFLGAMTRYLLGNLFGSKHLALTSDDTPLYSDLPSNMLGAFLMGWLGIVFKSDIRRISEHLAVGLTTGYLGSLTTFSGWHQKMIELSCKGHWVFAIAGMILGIFVVNEATMAGVESAEGSRTRYRKLRTKISSTIECKTNCGCSQVDIASRRTVAMAVMFFALLGMFFLGWALGMLKLRAHEDDAVLWLGCVVAPVGVWARWCLARFNGQGLGEKRRLRWLPVGTLATNFAAACLTSILAVISKAVDREGFGIVVRAIQFGLLGCMSTVSTFAAEVYTMRQSGHPGRAFVYTALTFLLTFALGTLFYSVPVWKKRAS